MPIVEASCDRNSVVGNMGGDDCGVVGGAGRREMSGRGRTREVSTLT